MQQNGGENELAQINLRVEAIKFYLVENNKFRGDQHGGMHTNERSHVKLITIGSNGPYGRR